MLNSNTSRGLRLIVLIALFLYLFLNCKRYRDRSDAEQEEIETITIGKRFSFDSFWIYNGKGELPGIREGLPSILENRQLNFDSIQIFEYTWSISNSRKKTSWFYLKQDSLIYIDCFEYSNSEEF